MVAVGTIKLRRADTANGIPMEWPPSTSVALGLFTPAISSARARPASTSPPTVFKMTSRPSISGSSSISTSCGMTCSYLVVFWASGARVWPSMVPMTVRQWMAWRPLVAGTVPLSVIRSCSSRWSAALSVGLSFGRDLVFFEVGSIASSPLSGLVCTERGADMRKKKSARYI